MVTEDKINKHLWTRVFRAAVIIACVAIGLVTLTSLIFNGLSQFPSTLPAPNGSDIQVKNERVHYQKWGTFGSPIVLVHGFLESTVSWDQVAPILAKDHVVYAMDLAGYGYSQYDGKYGLADEEQLVDGFIHKLHINKPILVGHSLGAAVVGDVAIVNPNDINGIIFADGDGLPLRSQGNNIRNLILDTPYFTSIYRILLSMHALDLGLFKNVCGLNCSAATPQLLASWLRPLRQTKEEQALKVIAKNGIIGITPQQIAKIKVPHALIWGQFDRTNGGSLAGAITNLHHPKVITIPAAGHLSMVANPAAFSSAVKVEIQTML